MDTYTMKAKEVIEKILYINLATADKNAKPWNSPLFFSHDKHHTFYWSSPLHSQHSKNIRENDNVFLTIYDSTAPFFTGFGVYIQAKACELTDEKEIQNALDYLYGRVGKKGEAKKFMGSYPRRMYKAIPEKVWVNGDGEVKGQYVDIRIEVDLRSSV